MSEEQHMNINNEYCPITRLSYPLSYLTGINEDIRGELVHSIIDLQQQQEQQQEQSMNTCAVPINVCCVCSHDENDLQSLHSDVQVLCATPGCKYNGPIHRKCLEHWDACCDFYCHLLNNSFNNSLLQKSSTFETISTIKPTISSSSSILSNFNDSPLHKSFMEGLFRLYECPACGQYTLYRSSIHSTVSSTSNATGQTSQTLSSTTSNHFTSVLCAIQYATEKLNQSENPIQSTLLHSDSYSQCKQYTSNSPVNYIGSMELSPNFLDDLKSQSKIPITNSSTTVRSHSYVQPPLITDRFSDILRRYSLSRETNDPTKFSTSNTSSSMSSGYHSGLSTGGHTVDPSRRCSDNSYDQFMLSMKEDIMKGNEDNCIPWEITNIQTGQSIPRALIKGKLPNDATMLNDVIKYSIDSSMPTTRKSYSSTINLDDLFDRSLDTTVNNNTTNNNDNNNNNVGNTNLMNRPLSAIGSRRHHSTSDGSGNISSSTVGGTTNTATTTTTTITTTTTNTSYHHNVKSNPSWSNDSIGKSRITHWHGNSNIETKIKKVVNAKGNIFLQRNDFNVFMNLPNYKQNAYFIQMDDDSCTGNEDTRAFLLAQLTNHRVSEVYCLACQQILPIYDHFPVIDGIFFISPLCHRSNEGHRKGGGLRVTWHTNGIQNQSVQQQQQTHRAHNATTNNTDNSSISNHLISSTNDYQSINEVALKLLAPLKIISPPPGCLGPRQQLNSTQHNMISTGTVGGAGSNQGAGNNNNNSSIPSRFSTNNSSTRQCRYLHALCLNCMHSENLIATGRVNDLKRIKCKICSKPWFGTSLLVGGLYTYDIFAAVPCCSAHLTCGSCQSRLDNLSLSSNSTISSPSSSLTTTNTTTITSTLQLSSNDLPHQHQYHDQNQFPINNIDQSINNLTIKSYPLNYFSQYSNLIICPYCSKVDYHFVKLFEDYYEVNN